MYASRGCRDIADDVAAAAAAAVFPADGMLPRFPPKRRHSCLPLADDQLCYIRWERTHSEPRHGRGQVALAPYGTSGDGRMRR